MRPELIRKVRDEMQRGIKKWGEIDDRPGILLNAATEELGEVAHAINHEEGIECIQQEIAETIGVLARLYEMVEVYNKVKG